ncbi:MAG: DNA double-strand break repair nuclease NurA [Candidatus Hodarchaeales archaeon]
MLDSKMFVKLKPLDISGLTIGGVDGGFFSKLLIGLDIFVFRAIAVFSTFDREGIVKTTYYPSRTPQLEVALSDIGLSSIEFEGLGSLKRAIIELQVASQVLELSEKKIDLLLLDGSPFLIKPLTSSPTILNYFKTYNSLLESLVFHASKRGVKIAWVVKDSRLRLLSNVLGKIIPFIAKGLSEILTIDYRKVVNNTRDMDLLFYLLEYQNRSMACQYNFSMPNSFKEEFNPFFFYIKTAKYDIPLRIDLFLPKRKDKGILIKEINILTKTILTLSQYNKAYGVPAPIVEADARARIREAEINKLFEFLKMKYPTPDFWLKRRERPPWRF